MFLGTHHPRLDEKGRLFLPAKFRDKLAGGLVMTRGQERCIYIFTTDKFADFTAGLQSSPITNAEARSFQRVMLSGATDDIPDKQGRVTVPALLRQYAGLDRDCTVIGVGDRVELWDTQRWEQFVTGAEEDFAARSEEVIPGGLF
ncbi:division/cell wall cluster transcriptional repressor MraZ [Branchiibius cervicis]|uniref:Transcriptional regulator MraZ n=1 Tax=Branchiibius cervicis TaxID=908252 RepID=A0ABW2AQU2_9MICO